MSNINLDFLRQKLWWRTYTTQKSFPTTKYNELVKKIKFATVAVDLEYKTSFSSTLLTNANVHLFPRLQITSLITKKALIKVFVEFVDFIDMFSLDLASKFYEHTEINNYAIKLVDGQQPLYRLIYSLEQIKLKTLKTYIKTNLANKFIRSSMLPTSKLFFFDQKLNRFF